jgi:hypothetical protein
MKIFDIRRGDIVRLKKLTDEDKQKIVKFAKRISEQSAMTSYARQVVNGHAHFKVEKCNQTKKIPTEYSLVKTDADILMAIQNRYLDLIGRIPKHPLTNIFSEPSYFHV